MYVDSNDEYFVKHLQDPIPSPIAGKGYILVRKVGDFEIYCKAR